jgi:riboflavin synthase
MFTGLIEAVGVVEQIRFGALTELWVKSPFESLVLGESIACDGCCLTVVETKGGNFRTQASSETLRRTTLGQWTAHRAINLERALKVGDRLGGHWVQGHVDAVGRILSTTTQGEVRVMELELPASLTPFFIEKGSVAIDGISLTVNSLSPSSFSITVIPETLKRTTLGLKEVGAVVNLEADLVGKYVARQQSLKGVSYAQLEAAGFVPAQNR